MVLSRLIFYLLHHGCVHIYANYLNNLCNRFTLIINVSPLVNNPPEFLLLGGRILADVQKRRFLNLVKIRKTL